jgi:benzoyl-CoA reductase/2-hydroxyglutaryl-CoA dehydratase subunit BcrC/BadD/HgdB
MSTPGTKDGRQRRAAYESWQPFREAIDNEWKRVWRTKEDGKILILRTGEFALSLAAGVPNSEHFELATYSQQLIARGMASGLFDDFDNLGYKDICSTLCLPTASMLTDRGPFGKLPRPDLDMSVQVCDIEGKIGQILSDHYKIPHFIVEMPKAQRGQKKEYHRNYLAAQMHECIEWTEKVTHLKWDDEAFIEGVRNEWECYSLWAKIVGCNKAIPAPLDQRSMGFFFQPAIMGSHKKWAVDLFKMLLDELQDRVKKGIGTIPEEKCRLLHEAMPPWYFTKMWKLADEYGAVFIGSEVMFGLIGTHTVAPDGTWVIAEPPEKRGIPLRTRNDAVNALADLYVFYLPFIDNLVLSARVEDTLKRVQDWHADGVVIAFDRGCHGVPSGLLDTRLEFNKRGIPNVIYEADNCDPRHFGENEVLDRLESFFETLGLKKAKV